MKKINKALFAVLLIPAYLTILVLLVGAMAGGIRWGYTAVVLAFAVAGAFFSSASGRLAYNIVGFAAFCVSGGYIIISSLNKPHNQQSGFEFVEIIVGIMVILFGLVPLVYHIVKRQKEKPPQL